MCSVCRATDTSATRYGRGLASSTATWGKISKRHPSSGLVLLILCPLASYKYECFQLSGREGENDQWILSRLSECVQRVDRGFMAYHFQQVTTALHTFWLYEFCDVYLESVKPVLYAK